MAEYSRLAKGTFTASGASGLVVLPFKPDYVELKNLTNINAGPVASKMTMAWWDASSLLSGNNITNIVGYNNTGTPAVEYSTILNTAAQPAINAFSAGQLLQYGPQQQVVASTKGTTTSFQVTGHGYSVGDVVIFQGLWTNSATTGMSQMQDIPMSVITVTDANNFIVNWNSNNGSYTNLSGSPTNAFVRKVLYPYLYEPGVNVITAITTGATTTIQTATAHNYVVGQEVAFRIPSQWGTVQLNSLPNLAIPGQPIYGYVISLTDNFTFVVNINSTAFTAFTTAVATTALGVTPPQVVAVGDVNTGGNLITSTSPLYPPPSFPTSSGGVSTINGPAIRGAYVNNTYQGFTIGAGVGSTTNMANVVIMAANDVIEYRALLHDLSNP